MTNEQRRLTINSKGEIVPKPYGPSRWASPRVRPCAHPDCPNPASVLKAADAHTGDATVTKAHNCCGGH